MLRSFYQANSRVSPWLIWAAFGLVYCVLQLGHLRQEVPLVVAHHLTDVLCLPLVLGLVLAVQRRRSEDPLPRLPRWHGLVSVFIYAIYFEVFLPRWDGRATADPADGVSYLIGWLLFEVFINRKVR